MCGDVQCTGPADLSQYASEGFGSAEHVGGQPSLSRERCPGARLATRMEKTMLQKNQCSDMDAGTTAAAPGRPAVDRALAAMDTGLERLAARESRVAAKLLPFRFAICKADGGEALVGGTMFAATASQVKSHAKAMASQALEVFGYSLQHRQQAEFSEWSVRVEARSMPLAAPPPFALRNEDWGTYGAELIVSGAPFFPDAVDNVVRAGGAARRPLQEGVADSYVRQILATDPEVRRARAAQREISWSVLSGYLPAKRSAARVALHVTADETAVALSPLTSMAALSILLRVSNYNRKNGMTGHRAGRFAVPASAVLRAAIASSQLPPDRQRVEEVEGALRYLRRMSLHALADSIKAQAAVAVQA